MAGTEPKNRIETDPEIKPLVEGAGIWGYMHIEVNRTTPYCLG